MKITCVYAYEPEITPLRKMIGETGWANNVSWRKRAGVQEESGVNFSDSDLVINAGFAGRLNNDLPLETIVLVGSLVDPVSGKNAEAEFDGNLLDPIDGFADENDIPEVSMVTVDKPVVSENKKKKLFEKFGADIVDMEGKAILQMSKKLVVPFICFKLISDNADENAPGVVAANKHRLAEKLGRALFPLFKTLVIDENAHLRHYSGL